MQPPETGRTKLTPEELESALALIRELFGIDTDDDPDPFIDRHMVAQLAGVSKNTPGQWIQRTRRGEMGKYPFPQPDDTRYARKPQWCAVTSIIEGFLLPRNLWPRGVGARPEMWGQRADTVKMFLMELASHDADLAAKVSQLRLDDGEARTPLQWRYRVRKAQNERLAA